MYPIVQARAKDLENRSSSSKGKGSKPFITGKLASEFQQSKKIKKSIKVTTMSKKKKIHASVYYQLVARKNLENSM